MSDLTARIIAGEAARVLFSLVAGERFRIGAAPIAFACSSPHPNQLAVGAWLAPTDFSLSIGDFSRKIIIPLLDDLVCRADGRQILGIDLRLPQGVSGAACATSGGHSVRVVWTDNHPTVAGQSLPYSRIGQYYDVNTDSQMSGEVGIAIRFDVTVGDAG